MTMNIQNVWKVFYVLNGVLADGAQEQESLTVGRAPMLPDGFHGI